MANELRRLDEENALASLRQIPGFNDLPPQKQKELIEKHVQNMVDAHADFTRKQVKSRTAENDMRVAIEALNQLSKCD